MSESLWGELPDTTDLRTPGAILKEQAQLFNDHYENMLIAKLTNGSQNKRRWHKLSLVAPALNNYTFDVLAAEHDITLYPVSMQAWVTGKSYKSASEAEFKSDLKDVLSSGKLRGVIQVLLAELNDNT